MALFLFFVFVVLVLVFRKKKTTKKAPVYNKPKANPFQQNSKPKPVHTITKPVNQQPQMTVSTSNPNSVVTDLAAKHFGWEWDELLRIKTAAFSKITNDEIRRKVALVYQALPQADLRDLMYSFINTSTALNYGADGKLKPRQTHLYDDLHRGIYALIFSGNFDEVHIKALLNTLIANFRQPKQQVAVAPIPGVIDIPQKETPIQHAPLNSPVTVSYGGYNPDDYLLGKKYKDKLGLKPQEVTWLNKFTTFSNAFTNIEGCNIAVINLYLASLKKLILRYANEKVTLSARMDEIKEAAYQHSKKENAPYFYYNHEEAKQRAESDLYYTVYKKAESVVRSVWNSGRSISASFNSRSPEAVNLYQQNIESYLDEIMSVLSAAIPEPDEETEILLNQKSTTRWRIFFDKINSDAGLRQKAKTEAILQLTKLNKKNPSVENIYFEAAKIAAPLDQVDALRFYLRYIRADQKSAKIDRKPLNKTTQKQLFKTPQQLAEFEVIVEELIVGHDLKGALAKAGKFYQVKRRTIQLDSHQIADAETQLNKTVHILNEYLEDEEEEIMVTARPATAVADAAINPAELAFADLFKSFNFQLPLEEADAFVRSHGLFKSQLIDGMNERCNETLDDVLIEEDDDCYVMNPDYYKKLFNDN